jgi:CRP-like cAMP-binding protein
MTDPEGWMVDIKNLISRCPLFKDLSVDEADQLAHLVEYRPVIPGEKLACANEEADFYFMLEKGALLLSTPGEKASVMESEGDFAGFELMTAPDGTYTAGLTVLESGSVLAFSILKFHEWLQEDEAIQRQVMSSWTEMVNRIAPWI